MSAISAPSQHLASWVWDQSGNILPELKNLLLEKAHQLFQPQDIMNIFIKGSLTGYRYDTNSDLDVNLIIKADKLPKEWEKTKYTRKTINDAFVPNSESPISFYLSPYNEVYINSLYKNPGTHGLYDLKNNMWVSPPNEKEKQQFSFSNEQDMAWAKVKAEAFNRDVRKYQSSMGTQKDQVWQKILDTVSSVETDRKEAYSIGFGDPRYSQENLVFKYFEKLLEYPNIFKMAMDALFKQRQAKKSTEKTASLKALMSGIESRLFQLSHSKSPALAAKTKDQLTRLKEYYHGNAMLPQKAGPQFPFGETRKKMNTAITGLSSLRKTMAGQDYFAIPETVKIQM